MCLKALQVWKFDDDYFDHALAVWMYVHYIAGRRDQCASGKIFAETGRQFEKEERERSIIPRAKA